MVHPLIRRLVSLAKGGLVSRRDLAKRLGIHRHLVPFMLM